VFYRCVCAHVCSFALAFFLFFNRQELLDAANPNAPKKEKKKKKEGGKKKKK
jgi:hypothetical protein